MNKLDIWLWAWAEVRDDCVLCILDWEQTETLYHAGQWDGTASAAGGIWVWMGVSCVSEVWTVWTDFQEYEDAYAASK